MTTTEKKEIIEKAFAEQDIFTVMDVMAINHRPHAYTIGAKHVAYASDNCGGRLGTETCEKVQCAVPGCRTAFADHTFDTVSFLQLRRNAKNE